MKTSSNVVCMIPTRTQSTRLPGKPLAKIKGTELILHAYQKACLCDFKEVFVTCGEDEEELSELLDDNQVPVVINQKTNVEITNGTERVYHAAFDYKEKTGDIYSDFCNFQGDIYDIDVSKVNLLLNRWEEQRYRFFDWACDRAQVYTPAVKSSVKSDDLSVTIVGKDLSGFCGYEFDMVYASKNHLPTVSLETYGFQYLYHIGLYIYTFAALNDYYSTEPSNLEEIENLEQLRFTDCRSNVTVIPYSSFGCKEVNTEEDLRRANRV